MKPRVCVLKADGTNCERETAAAFQRVGGDAEIVHINSLIAGHNPITQTETSLDNYHVLAIPGGFSFGDYVGSGKILAYILQKELGESVQRFINDGKLVIGICNGFQVLVKSGFLPMNTGKREQTATLTYNDTRRYEDRWVKLVSMAENPCVWTSGIDSIDLPVAHGEGKFVAPESTIDELLRRKLVVFQYADAHGVPTPDFPSNPNGSTCAIAGVCDSTGRIFGLMPHPERYNNAANHPHAALQRVLAKQYVDKSDASIADRASRAGTFEAAGMRIFQNGIEYAAKHLLNSKQ